jgi:hypothetical protein
MEEVVKRRGRKKTIPENDEEVIIEQKEEPIKKKRGRKKKWETTPFKNNYSTDGSERVTFKESNSIDPEKYNTNALNFGNLCIKVHDKEIDQNINLDNYFVNKKSTNCEIELSSDEEDTCDVKKDNTKTLRQYTNDSKFSDAKLEVTQIRCFYCHHTFDNPPFYLPYDYSSVIDRYKLFGNFCSPNCVKAYCIDNKTFQNKTHLIGQFYRKLFGPDFRITPAPSILNLDSYGGKMSIEEFRKSLYTNSRYTINNINSKVVHIN